MQPQNAAVFELHAAGKTHVVYERRQLEDVNYAIHEVEPNVVQVFAWLPGPVRCVEGQARSHAPRP